MTDAVDPQVFQTWKQARLRALQSLLELARTDKPKLQYSDDQRGATGRLRWARSNQWKDERENAIGILTWAMRDGLDEVTPYDCPDFPELVNEMRKYVTENEHLTEEDDRELAETVRNDKLEMENYYVREANKRGKAIDDATRELNEVLAPAIDQWKSKVRNGTAADPEGIAEYLRISARIPELESRVRTNRDELVELRKQLVEWIESRSKAREILESAREDVPSDLLNKSLAEFAIKSVSWHAIVDLEAPDTSGFWRLVIRVAYKLATFRARMAFLFKR